MMEVYAQLSCDGPIALDMRCTTEPLSEEHGDRNAVGILRQDAKARGWKRIEGHDLCPRCARKYKERIP